MSPRPRLPEGMDVALARPKGYDLVPEIELIAQRQAAESGGSAATRLSRAAV